MLKTYDTDKPSHEKNIPPGTLSWTLWQLNLG